jgi:alanine racemase
MDMCMVDLTELPEVQAGDEVEIFGARADLNKLAAAARTITYELLCAVSKRVPRIWREF